MATTSIPPIIQQKLSAFDHMEAEFEASFQFVEAMHGQTRFPTLTVADIVRYLHALWVCNCKTYLLSVARTVKEYEGRLALELLRRWQLEGDTARVVAFLQRKLDMLPLADITRQVQEAHKAVRSEEDGSVERLMHGRTIMLNRGMNLLHALDALFAVPEDQLSAVVREACGHYGHLADQIELQLEQMDSPLYAFVPHQLLAQRNMVIMNKLGINVMQRPADLPGQRSWRVTTSEDEQTSVPQPFAEHVVRRYQELISPQHNNLRKNRFVDRPDRSDDATI